MKKPIQTKPRARKLSSATQLLLDDPVSPSRSRAATTRHSSGSTAASPFPSDDTSQHFDRQNEALEVDDSDGSSLSPTMSIEDPYDHDPDWTSPQLQQTTPKNNARSQLPPSDDVPEEEIINTALIRPPIKRHELLPQVFDTHGRLLSPWNDLQPRIRAARQEQKKQSVPNKQKVQSLLKDPIGFPKLFNVPPTSKTLRVVVPPVTAEKPQISFQNDEAGVIARHRRGGSTELLDPALTICIPESSPSLFPQADKRPTTGIFPTQSRKKNRSKLKTYGQERKRSSGALTHKAQGQAGYGHTERMLRPRIPPTLPEPSLSLPAIIVCPQQNTSQLLSHPQAELPLLSETRSSTPPKAVETSPVPFIKIADSARAPERNPSPPLSPQTDLILATSPARQEVTTNEIQQQLFLNSGVCNTCHQKGLKGCSCNHSQEPPEGISCSDTACYMGWWRIDDLWRHCGIKLGDAQEIKRIFNCWFCPQCSNKARVLLQSGPTSSSLSSTHDPTTSVQETSGHSDSPGNEIWPEDAEIREPLQYLTGEMQRYTGNTAMARNKLSTVNPQTPILNIPCIRDETLDHLTGVANNVINILRKLLDVPDGVLIRDKVLAVQLQDTTCSMWIHGVLSYLVNDFVFHSGSPFEDTIVWRKILTDADHAPDQAVILIHDHHIRIMKAYEKSPEDPDIPPEFLDRMSRRRQAFIEQLNATMLPLVGGDSEVQARHQKIAKVASELNLKTSAYRGTFEEVKPIIHDPFDPERHAEENQESESLALAGRPILMTMMMGVRFKHPEKDWRICSQAKVKVWPVNDALRDQPKRIPLPDVPGGSASKQSSHRIIPKKRQTGELN